mgnify:CR=1 FL=1
MIGVNKVILIGNLGKDPEVITFDTAKKATFPLATTEFFKNKDGQKIEQTDWATTQNYVILQRKEK